MMQLAMVSMIINKAHSSSFICASFLSALGRIRTNVSTLRGWRPEPLDEQGLIVYNIHKEITYEQKYRTK